ncbi:hypothetical protein DUNSADRAFT_6284 [Dunaliella salina]|uniref:Uncharacterized protein n=1 Tax=Dunaliella salina TaxID=3046 RepID=A0ABQ7FUT2_DUNSA|nr:hypothetical protein DUNSADRAFT_6284 [Dunaliella salina]|eukprot:KAF5825866.1 hypothetical protein DUNSADRAFT_6284 [Dunaliella salina]
MSNFESCTCASLPWHCRPFHPRRLFDFFQKYWVLQEPDWSEAMGETEPGPAAAAAASSETTSPSPISLAPTDFHPVAEQQPPHCLSLPGSTAEQPSGQHQQASASTNHHHELSTSAGVAAPPIHRDAEPAVAAASATSACAHRHHEPCTSAGAAAYPPVQQDAEPAVAAARAAAAQLAEAAQQVARAAEGLASAWVSRSSTSPCCAKGCCLPGSTHGAQQAAPGMQSPPAPCSTAPSHPYPAPTPSPQVDVCSPQLSCSPGAQPFPSPSGVVAWQARQQAAADLGAAAAAATAAGARATSASFEAMRIVVDRLALSAALQACLCTDAEAHALRQQQHLGGCGGDGRLLDPFKPWPSLQDLLDAGSEEDSEEDESQGEGLSAVEEDGGEGSESEPEPDSANEDEDEEVPTGVANAHRSVIELQQVGT